MERNPSNANPLTPYVRVADIHEAVKLTFKIQREIKLATQGHPRSKEHCLALQYGEAHGEKMADQ